MARRPMEFFWGLGYPKLKPSARAELLKQASVTSRLRRTVAGLSLLVSILVCLLLALTIAQPFMSTEEAWVRLSRAHGDSAVVRWLDIGAAGALLAFAIASLWCLVTSAWVYCMRKLHALPEPTVEAIARGNYFL